MTYLSPRHCSFFAAAFAAAALTATAAHSQGPAYDFAETSPALLASATAPASFHEVAVESALTMTPSAAVSSSNSEVSSSVAAALPDAPSATLLPAYVPEGYVPQDPLNAKARSGTSQIAPIYTKYIPAGWQAQKLTAHDKVILGVRDLYAPFTFVGMVASAGYAHVLNGQPNYGTDRGAFGQRLGAAALRDTSEGLFSDVILAPLFHEDPRYYVQGPTHNFFERIIYAGTRPIITRTDGGHSSINAAVLVGYAGASALSYTYYPPINQNGKDTVATFGGALAGTAVGDVVSEFADQFLQAIHLEKRR